MKLRVDKIKEAAKNRPDGYEQDVFLRGTIEGEWLEISNEALAELREKYRPKPEKVKLAQIVSNFATAIKDEAIATIHRDPLPNIEEIERRMSICQECEFFLPKQKRCMKCGCFLRWKTALRSQKCPIEKW
jgi:uncharacterized paraquat-inducible protein A